jgi:hypothetical protein
MKRNYVIVALALVAPVSATWAVPPADVNSLPTVPCTEIRFSHDFLDRYPRAPAACQEARVYQGQKWARFTARVFLNSSDRTTVQFLNRGGTPIETFSFRPRPGATLTLDGQTRRFTDLRPGDELQLWVPESRMTVSPYPGATTEESWAMLPPVRQPGAQQAPAQQPQAQQ